MHQSNSFTVFMQSFLTRTSLPSLKIPHRPRTCFLKIEVSWCRLLPYWTLFSSANGPLYSGYLTLTLLSLFWGIACSGLICSMQRVKEKFCLQLMSVHPRMPEFLKMDIVCANGIPLGTNSLTSSRFLENFQFPENWGKFKGEGSNK